MTTKFNVFITLYGEIDSNSLYAEIKNFNANVTDLIVKTIVYLTIDVREPIIEYILQKCYKYSPDGHLEVEMKKVE